MKKIPDIAKIRDRISNIGDFYDENRSLKCERFRGF